MSGRPAVRSPFDNLRPTIVREPSRTVISADAEFRLLDKPEQPSVPLTQELVASEPRIPEAAAEDVATKIPEGPLFGHGTILKKKKRDRLLLVSFRMPQTLKERLESAAKRHEVNQTDIINEAIELNLQRYL